MRVLLVNRSAEYHTGGANRVVVETHAMLKEAGHEAEIAHWHDAGGACPSPEFHVQGTDYSPSSALRELADSFRPDVIQFHQVFNPELELEIARKHPVCHFLHDQSWFCSGGDRMSSDCVPCHMPHLKGCLVWHYLQGCGGMNPAGNWDRWKQAEARVRLLHAKTVRWQVASEFMRTGLEENGVFDSEVDLVRLYAKSPKHSEETEDGLIVAATRLVRNKGVELLLDAMKRLSGIKASLVIAGDGPLLPQLQAMVSKAGLGERVRFLGEISPDELDRWYARAQIVVHPTLRPEPFGLVGPEAMAHGKPVVAFEGGATGEWLEDGATGFIADDRTSEDLATAMERLLRAPDYCQSLGEKGRKHWQEHFQPGQYFEALMQSFESTIASFQAAS